jgi:hypothetical protein
MRNCRASETEGGHSQRTELTARGAASTTTQPPPFAETRTRKTQDTSTDNDLQTTKQKEKQATEAAQESRLTGFLQEVAVDADVVGLAIHSAGVPEKAMG